MVVFRAIRKYPSGEVCVVGYFKTKEEIPEGWEVSGTEDISGVMKSVRKTDVDQVLAMMNQHWKDPYPYPRCPETMR